MEMLVVEVQSDGMLDNVRISDNRLLIDFRGESVTAHSLKMKLNYYSFITLHAA